MLKHLRMRIECLRISGVDGVMIGRAALGNPWMIYQTVKYLETGMLMDEPSVREKMDVCVLHMDRLIALKSEHLAVREMRKHAAWYLKGIHGNAKARREINECNTREDIVKVLFDLVDEIEEKEQNIQMV